MNEIVIVYGKLSLKIFIIKIDESKVYYENKIINITKEQISNLLNILVSFDDKSYDINILDRLETIFEDKGSGRLGIWENTWEMQMDSSLAGWIFGHGFNAVYINSVPQYSAHNDFLEVLYDFGIIGFILYINFYIIIIKYSKKLYNARSKYTAPFVSSIVLALIMSITSHLIIFPTYFIYLCLFWGVIIADCDKNLKLE